MGLRRGEVVGAVVVAAIQVGATAAAAHNQPATGRPYGPLAWALLLLSAAGLLLRRRSPEAALVVTSVPVWVYLALGYPGGPVFLAMIGALVGAIVRGHRIAAWVALAVGYPMFVWVAPLVGGRPPPSPAAAIGVAAWLVAFAVVVELVHDPAGAGGRVPPHPRGGGAAAGRRGAAARSPANCTTCSAHNISLINVQAGVALHLMDEQPGAGPHRADRDQGRPAGRRWASCARCSSVLPARRRGRAAGPGSGPGRRWTRWSSGPRPPGCRSTVEVTAPPGRCRPRSSWRRTGSCRRR